MKLKQHQFSIQPRIFEGSTYSHPWYQYVTEEDNKVLIQIPEHMELIDKAKSFIDNNCSYKETAEWLSHHTGRNITGMGLREVLKRVIHKGW